MLERYRIKLYMSFAHLSNEEGHEECFNTVLWFQAKTFFVTVC